MKYTGMEMAPGKADPHVSGSDASDAFIGLAHLEPSRASGPGHRSVQD